MTTLSTEQLNDVIDSLKQHIAPNVKLLDDLRAELAAAKASIQEKDRLIDTLKRSEKRKTDELAEANKIEVALRSFILSGDPQWRPFHSMTLLDLVRDHVIHERERYRRATVKRHAAAAELNKAIDWLQHWVGSLKGLYNEGTLVYALPQLCRFTKPSIPRSEALEVLEAISGAIKALEGMPEMIDKAKMHDNDLPEAALDSPEHPNKKEN